MGDLEWEWSGVFGLKLTECQKTPEREMKLGNLLPIPRGDVGDEGGWVAKFVKLVKRDFGVVVWNAGGFGWVGATLEEELCGRRDAYFF